MKERTFSVREVGTVECDQGEWRIRFRPDMKQALTGLQGFSHLQVYWWAHLTDTGELRSLRVTEKPYKKGPDTLGIFATRSPVRPNPIAMTVVPVTWIDSDEGILGMAYIDAENGTPVLDVKPYYGMERIREYTLPAWCAHWPAWYEDAGAFDWAAEFENAQ